MVHISFIFSLLNRIGIPVMEFQIHHVQIMQQTFAKLSLLNVKHTLAESTFPFHLCPDNDLMANYKRNPIKSNH